jgi:hypothetical protein
MSNTILCLTTRNIQLPTRSSQPFDRSGRSFCPEGVCGKRPATIVSDVSGVADLVESPLGSGIPRRMGMITATTVCHSLLNAPASAYFTIITVQGLCSLTRSLVLPRKKRAIRECP